MADRYNKKEEYYFATTIPKHHLIITETGQLAADKRKRIRKNKDDFKMLYEAQWMEKWEQEGSLSSTSSDELNIARQYNE